MADNAPAAKRAKRDKFVFDSSSDDDDDSVMDTESNILTSDTSENDWVSQSSKHSDDKLNRKPLVLKVPRGKAMVPERVLNPGSALISDKRRNEILPEQFKALSQMPLDHICIFAETSKAFKEIALKFFAMKYRDMNLASLVNPSIGKIRLIFVMIHYLAILFVGSTKL